MKLELDRLDHLVLTVTEIDRTVGFYCDVLGMRAETFRPSDGSLRHALMFGQQKINLHLAGAEFEPRAARAAPGTADLCFLSRAPLADWQMHLENAGIAIEAGPVQRTGAQGPIR